MTARRRRSSGGPFSGLVGLALIGMAYLAFRGGGDFREIQQRFIAILVYTVIFAVALGGLALLVFVVLKSLKKRRQEDGRSAGGASSFSPVPPTPRPNPEWTNSSIREALGGIDWFQFEKFSSALLRGEGYEIERMGGAKPDGGVDLIATKDGVRTLVQCKHWRTWDVKEPTVRELLGSMVDFNTGRGAIYTLKGWTEPAARLASRHGISLADGGDLAFRAKNALDYDTLNRVLDSSVHHCPKCEGPMVLKTGTFSPFWSCVRFPACRGKLNYTGAR